MAHHDVLTGLLNRQEFKTRLEESISQSQITSESVAIIFVDVDKFKSINDTFGHAAGDHVLRTIANRIKAQCHDNCQAIRYGGDEFVIMIRGEGAEKSNLPVFMESLRRAMTEKVHFQGLSFPVTCSIGGASYPEDAGCPTDLLKAADTAVFNAKSSGRDCYVLYEHRRSKHSSGEENLIDDMRHGLEAEHFFLEYQPQYALETGQISGVEALLRWDHPKFGRMMPGQFLGLAEESRLIVPLGLWAVEEACRQGRAWQDKGIVPITIAVNISDRQAQSHTFVKDISAALEASSFAAEFLELEFKESLLDQDKVFASRILCELKAMGVRLAIDDFGTGNSLLALIKDFTFDRLKLDRSFVSALEDQKADRTLFRVIASMGRELEFDVVAEGVETAEQLEFLKNCHCKAAQGFYLGHPQRADALQALLEVTP